ncbi:hypothetical protein B0A55_03101 [Friedmanniomyces simplex]|uniref:Uncharacterized protein n=1 Tax=Friedmanniomyces simplex TaxID=329884 RepID=A0A4U0XNB0_9PEZI|nr:hypothetical protein B0A55_03101 [Friedmanniomyces simplex]
MQPSTFALVIAIVGNIMAFPASPLDGGMIASGPPNHPTPPHRGTIMAALTGFIDKITPAGDPPYRPVPQHHGNDYPATGNVTSRAEYSPDLAAHLETLRLEKRGCDLDCESFASWKYGGANCNQFCHMNKNHWRCKTQWPPQCFKKARVTAENLDPVPGGE